MKTVSSKNCLVVFILLMTVSGCSSAVPNEWFPLVLESPTVVPCSLETLVSRITSTPPSTTKSPESISNISWSKYEDSGFGYSFEYPTAYENNADQQCRLAVIDRLGDKGQEVYIGSSVAIYIRQIQHSSWKDDACLLVLDFSNNNQLISLNETIFAEEEALEIGYNAPWKPDGRQVLFQHDGLFYIITTVNDPQCTIEGTTIDSNMVYQHMLDSFRFEGP